MKATLIIIAAALISGTASAQTEVKTNHTANTSVEVNRKAASVSTEHNQATNVKSKSGTGMESQSTIQSDINTEKAGSKVKSKVDGATGVAAEGAQETSIRTKNAAKATKKAAIRTENAAADVSMKTVAQTHAAAVKVNKGGKATAGQVGVQARSATANNIQATKAAKGSVRAATPKPRVKVTSNSAVSIKR